MNPFTYILIVSFVISLISAWILSKKKGYRFATTLISSFIGITALLLSLYTLIKPYLK